MKSAALLVLLLSFIAPGRSTPDCERALKPITLDLNELKGKYAFIGGTSSLPGTRFMSLSVSGAWVEAFPTSQSDVFEFLQAERLFIALGRSTPDCERALKPITLDLNGLRGKYVFIGGTSSIPGTRFMPHVVSGAWVEAFPTSQSDVFEFLQAERLFGKCFTLKFNMTVEEGSTVIKQPFYMKDDFLMSDCPDCVTLYEVAISGQDTYNSLMLFSKSRTVPAEALDFLKKQAECLKMPSVLIADQSNELCPDDPDPTDGINAFNNYLEAKVTHIFARILDAIFDLFVN